MDQFFRSGDEGSSPNSSLETGGSTMVPATVEDLRPRAISPFRLNRTAFFVTGASLLAIGLVVGAALLVTHFSSHKNPNLSSQQADNYAVTDVSVAKISDNQLQVAPADTLAVNGQLVVNKTLVLSPTAAPTTPVVGEMYYDQSTEQPYFYNGSKFVSLEGVSSLGGNTGSIGLGSSLQISGNNLSISSTFLQSVNSNINSPKVNSLQGLTGNVSLVGTNGIAINGSTITNTGVVSLSTDPSGGLAVDNKGGGKYTINFAGSGVVNLSPGTVQTDNSNGDTIAINKTGSGNLIDLQTSGSDTFVVDNTGRISVGSIDYSNVNGAPITTVTDIAGAYGSLGLGSGLGLNFSGDSLVNTGVTSISGTANQIDVSGSTGDLTVSLPSTLITSGTISVQGAGGVSLGVPNVTNGTLTFANALNGHLTSLQSAGQAGQDQTITIPASNSATDTVCLKTLANCVGTGGSVLSSGGTIGALARFTGTQAIGDSALSDDGTTVTVSEPLVGSVSVTTPLLQSAGALTITPGGKLTAGSLSQILALQGNANSTFKISSGGFSTTVGFVTPTGNRSIDYPNESGTICLQNSTSCGFATSGSGVTTLNGLSGTLNLANASGSGSTITINNALADGATKGIATFSSTNFTSTAGVIDTIQGISSAASPTFAGLTINGDVALASGHTVKTDNISDTAGIGSNSLNISSTNNINFSNQGGTNSFLFPTTGGLGQVICTSGITCASGGGQAVILEPGGVQSANSSTHPGIYINKASGSANLVQLQTGGNDAFVINSSGNTTISNITTINSVYTNSITPTATLTVGSTSQSFSLQGNGSSTVSASNGTYSTSLGFNIGSGGTAPTGNVTYQLQNDSSVLPGTYSICTTAGNCAGVGGSVTTSGGVTGVIPIYTSSSNLGNSILTGTASQITVGGDLAVGVASTTAGNLIFNNSANSNKITLQLSANPSANAVIKVPNVGGTIAVSASGPLSLDPVTGALSCSTCLTSGGGSGGGVSSIVGGTSGLAINGALTIANASTSVSTITIDNAKADGSTKGIAAFNSTNFSDNGSGVINTKQDIATTSSPSFANLNVQGSTGLTIGTNSTLGQLVFRDGSSAFSSTFSSATLTGNRTITVPNASGTLAVSASGNLALDAVGNLSIVNNPTFSASVTTPSLKLNAGSGNLVTLSTTQANNIALSIPADTNTTDVVCLQTLNNCAGSGVTNSGPGTGNLNYVTKFTTGGGTQVALSQIYDNGSFVGINTTTNSGQLSIVASGTQAATYIQGAASGSTAAVTIKSGGGSGDLLDLNGGGSIVAKVDVNGNLTAVGGTFSGNISQTGSTTFGTGTGAVSLNGDTTVASGKNFTVSGSGSTSLGGSLTTTGLATLNGGLTVSGATGITGATTINTTGTANTSIGNSSGTFALQSTGLNVSTLGALTGVTSIAASTSGNTINGLVINSGALSSVAGITGSSALSVSSTGANALTLDTGGASTVNLGTTNATTINVGHSSGTVPTVAIQGNAVTVASTNGTNSTTLGFANTQVAGNIIYNFDRSATAGTYNICTSANNCLGSGSSSGGANNALSNLYNVAINTDLLGNANNSINLGSAGTTFKTGYFGTSVVSPVVQSTGSLSLNTNGANTRAILDTSGNLTFQQASTVGVTTNGTANGAGYALTINAGNANGSTTGNNGGALNLQGGATAGTGTYAGGTVNITGGTGSSSSGNSNGGAVNITGGTTNASNYASGGNVTIQGGLDNSTNGNYGGNVSILGGNSNNNAPGSVTIDSGSGPAGNASAAINIGTSNAGVLTVGNATSSFALTSKGLNVVTSGSNTTVNAANISTNGVTGNNLVLQGGNETGTGSTGGNVSIQAGTGTSNNGAINIGTTTAKTLSIGNSSGTFQLASSALNISTVGAITGASGLTFSSTSTIGQVAQPTSNTAGYNLTVQSSTGNGTGNGGTLTLQAGTSGSGATGNGGATNVSGGSAASTSGNGGALSLAGGSATGLGNGGTVVIQGGQGGNSTTGNGGGVSIIGGTSSSTNGNGGSISLTTGTTTGTGTAGTVIVKAGTNGNSSSLFQVQNAAGTTALNVDTTSSNLGVTIQSGTSGAFSVKSSTLTANENPAKTQTGSGTAVYGGTGSFSQGYEFTALSNGNVTQLGANDAAGTYTVNLYAQASSTLLATASVTTTGYGNWVYTSISSVALTAGTTYWVALYNTAGNAYATSSASITTGTVTPNIYIIGNGYASGNSMPGVITGNFGGQPDITFVPTYGNLLQVDASTNSFRSNATTNVFKSLTNSTTAFAVQNASGTSVLNVDTTNQTLTVRAGTDAAVLGSELYPTNNFSADWTNTGWNVGTTTQATHTSGNTSVLQNNTVAITAGAIYQVSYQISGTCAASGVSASLGGVTFSSVNYPTCAGTYTYIFTASNTNKLAFSPGSTWTGIISSVSIKQITASIKPALAIQNTSGTNTLEVRSNSASSDTFIGLSSGQYNTSGAYNTALGVSTLASNTTGTGNTAVGFLALQSNVSGGSNTALGYNTLSGNTTGSSNVAVGYNSNAGNLTGSSNTTVGNWTLVNNTSGTGNSALGYLSMYSNSVGSYNSSQGYFSLEQNTTGSYNAAQGSYSLYNNTTGNYNSGLGYDAGASSSQGQFRTLNNLQNTTSIGAYSQTYGSNVISIGGQGEDSVQVGIGTGLPSNQLSVESSLSSPGTVALTSGNTTIVGTGTSFTSAMVGDTVYVPGANGNAAYTSTISSYTDSTHVVMSVAPSYSASTLKYYINGTVTTTSSSGTVTGTGTAFTSSMVGDVIYIASNSTSTAPYVGTITAYSSATSITVSPVVPAANAGSGQSFYINAPGLQVSTAGNIGIGTLTVSNKLSVNSLTTADNLAQAAIGTGGASNKGLVIQGVTSQTADLLDAESSNGSVVAKIDASGNISGVAATFSSSLTAATASFYSGYVQVDSFGDLIAGNGAFGVDWTGNVSTSGSIYTSYVTTSDGGYYTGNTTLTPGLLSSSTALNVRATNATTLTLGGVGAGSGSWTTGTANPHDASARQGFTTWNGYAYQAGTYETYYAPINTAGGTGTWTTTSNLGVAGGDAYYNYGGQLVAASGYIYDFPGYSGYSTKIVTAAALNADGTINSNTFTASTFPVNRYDSSIFAANGYMYVIAGGSTTSYTTAQSTVYYAKINANGTLGSWSTNGSSGLGAVFDATPVVSNGIVYIIGGKNTSGTSLSTIYYATLNATTGAIGSWTTSANALNTAVYGGGAVANGGTLYVIGGNTTVVQASNLNLTTGAPGSWYTSGLTALPAAQTDMGVYLNAGTLTISGGTNATSYYAPWGHVSVMGSLDLVSTQGGGTDANNNSAGELVAGNTTVVGNFQVRGQGTFAGSLSTSSSLSVGNGAYISTGGVTNSGLIVQTVASQSSGYAFQAQDYTGASLAYIDYQGNLSVKTATFNGHIITGNTSGSTTAAVGANAGSGGSPTCTVSGNDTGGQITLTTGTSGWLAGIQCTVTFSSSYTAAPHPVITPANGTGTNSVQPYVTSGTSSWTINFVNADTAQHTYMFNYFNAQ